MAASVTITLDSLLGLEGTYALLEPLTAVLHTTLALQELPVTTLALQASHTAITLTENTDALLGLAAALHTASALQERPATTLALEKRHTAITLTEG